MGVNADIDLRVSSMTVLGTLERHARDAADRAAKTAAEAARRLAPAAATHRAGPGRAKRVRESIRPSVRRSSQGVTATVGPNLRQTFYAGFVERGTENMEAQPFIEPARALTEHSARRELEAGAAAAAVEIGRRLA